MNETDHPLIEVNYQPINETMKELRNDLIAAKGTISDDLHAMLCQIVVDFIQDFGPLVRRINELCEKTSA
jgi:hypothetical protein